MFDTVAFWCQKIEMLDTEWHFTARWLRHLTQGGILLPEDWDAWPRMVFHCQHSDVSMSLSSESCIFCLIGWIHSVLMKRGHGHQTFRSRLSCVCWSEIATPHVPVMQKNICRERSKEKREPWCELVTTADVLCLVWMGMAENARLLVLKHFTKWHDLQMFYILHMLVDTLVGCLCQECILPSPFSSVLHFSYISWLPLSRVCILALPFSSVLHFSYITLSRVCILALPFSSVLHFSYITLSRVCILALPFSSVLHFSYITLSRVCILALPFSSVLHFSYITLSRVCILALPVSSVLHFSYITLSRVCILALPFSSVLHFSYITLSRVCILALPFFSVLHSSYVSWLPLSRVCILPPPFSKSEATHLLATCAELFGIVRVDSLNQPLFLKHPVLNHPLFMKHPLFFESPPLLEAPCLESPSLHEAPHLLEQSKHPLFFESPPLLKAPPLLWITPLLKAPPLLWITLSS